MGCVCVCVCVCVHTMENQPKNEWNVICNNVDGLGEYYGQWSKTDRERQILYVITYMWSLKSETS